MWSYDLKRMDYLIDPDACPEMPLVDTAHKGAVAVMHSHMKALRQWVGDAASDAPPQRGAASDALLLVLEDDVSIGDAGVFVERVAALLRVLQPQAFDVINLLAPESPPCETVAPAWRVRGAAAEGLHLTRPLMSTSRTHGLLWSLRGAQRALASLPCGLAVDLYLRHLVRVWALDLINSCDGIVREVDAGSIKDDFDARRGHG